MKNKYCDLAALRNEADVEQNFVRRLLEDFDYSDTQILPKHSLDALTIGGMRGHAKRNYKPDFGLRLSRKIRWIVEAKSPDETDLDQHEWQPRAYCVLINGTGTGEKPTKYHLLTNGTQTRLYDPYLNEPLLTLRFSDFVVGNKKFKKLRGWLSRDAILDANAAHVGPTLTLKKPGLAEVNAAFSWCHQHIYKKDNISQSDAFSEFVKLISLKLMSDRRIRDQHPDILQCEQIEVPVGEVDFCEHWVELNERNFASPINEILFRNFMRLMEADISREKRKRIFELNDEIRLKPETIRGVVKRLETMFLFGIDADLNGRLFETFLNATMRGKDLGQFFTPRSVVKLGIAISDIRVHQKVGGEYHTDTLVDACCGTGGFLIDALADMWTKADRKNLSSFEKEQLKKEIKNNHLVGVDIANAPKLARIARLNMYLHGDGGTRIFHLNALDKDLGNDPSDAPDIEKEKRELRRIFQGDGFDIALTNPPFAKAVDRETKDERRILDQYEVATIGNTPRSSVRSALLFFERYRDVLKPGGRLVTIVDDGILSGEDHQWFRDKLREWFLIRAVVSLPGDAFQRSNARVKTSYLVAEKRDPEQEQTQPPVFMYPCQFVGIDDQKRQRARAGDARARSLAEQEIKTVVAEYERFKGGVTQYTVAPNRVLDRLDVKNCLMHAGRSISLWEQNGFGLHYLSDIVEPREYADEDVVTKDHLDPIQVLVVRYEGIAEAGDEILASEGSYARLYPVTAGDIVISNIAASHGSIAVVSVELDKSVVSSEYTVLKVKDGFDPMVVQLIIRSPEIRADLLLSASGANRTRTRWDLMKNLKVPYPNEATVANVKLHVAASERAKRQAALEIERARDIVEQSLLLRNSTADTILAAFRPPK